jgi:hypothetical protein
MIRPTDSYDVAVSLVQSVVILVLLAVSRDPSHPKFRDAT